MGNEDVNGLIAECNGGGKAHQIFQLIHGLHPESRLFLQFPERTEHLGLTGIIQLAGRDLQRKTVQRIAVLAHHEDFPVCSHRQDGRRPVVVDKVPLCLVTVGKDRVLIYLKDVSLILKLSVQTHYGHAFILNFVSHCRSILS